MSTLAAVASRSQTITDGDRRRAAEHLERACGEGRMGLDEFSDRVGDVWEAETGNDLARALDGLAPPTPVRRSAPQASGMPVAALRRSAGWLRTLTAFGTTALDVRHAEAEGVVEVSGTCLFGDVRLTVPENVAVELTGLNLFGTQDVQFCPAPHGSDAPVVRVTIHVLGGRLSVVRRPVAR